MRGKKLETDQRQVYRMLVIADAARGADASELETLEGELNTLVANCVNKLAEGSTDASQLPASSLAIDHARRAVERRRSELLSALARAPASQGVGL
jgi:hypothetical protein